MTKTAPVEVTMHIKAAPEDVFPYFTDPARYVQWMGTEATLEPEPGGMYRVHMSDGFKAAGTFLQVEPLHLIVFTWGFADEEAAQHVKHEQREGHRIAWNAYLPRLAMRAAGGDPGADPHS